MRILSEELADHLSGSVTTLCHCWIVRRVDGVVLGFTDHDRDLIVDGISCAAVSALDMTEAVNQLGMSSDGQDVLGALSSAAISVEDIRANRYDNARVETWLVNWQSPDENVHLRTAILGEITETDGQFRAELRGLTSLLDQRYGRTYSRQCDAKVGDARCRVALDDPAYFAEGLVLSVSASSVIKVSNLDGFDNDWFSGGELNWTGGANVGLLSEVLSSSVRAQGELVLWSAPPFPIAEGDTFRVTAGCNKSFATCRKKFNNVKNFRGCPHMPGADFALGYAVEGAVHDGSPLVR